MKLLCLANSYKEGGRCVAGVLLHEDHSPVRVNGNPVWIRPVGTSGHGQLPTEMCQKLKPLDVIELSGITPAGEGYQSENYLFSGRRIYVLQRGAAIPIEELYSHTALLFGNRGKVLSEEEITGLQYSLLLIRSTKFRVTTKLYEGNQKPKYRLVFEYKGIEYDLPITDPLFLEDFEKDSTLLAAKAYIDIVLSISVCHKGLYYKLVATILYPLS